MIDIRQVSVVQRWSVGRFASLLCVNIVSWSNGSFCSHFLLRQGHVPLVPVPKSIMKLIKGAPAQRCRLLCLHAYLNCSTTGHETAAYRAQLPSSSSRQWQSGTCRCKVIVPSRMRFCSRCINGVVIGEEGLTVKQLHA